MVGVAQRVNGQRIGVWDPDGSSGNIYHGSLPAGVIPGIGLQGYRVGADDPQNPTTQQRVQFWLIADSFASLDDLDAAIYDAFQGLAEVDLNGVHVTQVISQSSIPQGIDGSGNPQRSCNYTFQIDLPATALRAY